MKQTELEMIEKEAKNLQKQFNKKGNIGDGELQARACHVANDISNVETKKQKAAKAKLKWQDTLTKFVIGVYRRTHKNLLDSMKEAVRVRRETIETFISADIDTFEESEADDLWTKPLPLWLQNYDTIDVTNRNISLAVKATNDNKVFEVFVMTSNDGEVVHFKFLTIKVSETYVSIDKDEFCPSIALSTETVYKIIDKAVKQVNTILTYALPSQIDLAIKVSQYKLNKMSREMKDNYKRVEKERDETLAQLKKYLGQIDE